PLQRLAQSPLLSPISLCDAAAPQPLHSFPTRRSSDLLFARLRRAVGQRRRDLALAHLAAAVGGERQRLHRHQVHDARERALVAEDRKSTRLNSSHLGISYAVFCLKKKRRYAGLTREIA